MIRKAEEDGPRKNGRGRKTEEKGLRKSTEEKQIKKPLG
jgi:hypothetical protein